MPHYTSVLIDYLRGRPGFPPLESVSELYLPAMVLAELQVGWLRTHGSPHRQLRRFEDLVSIMFFLPIQRSTVLKLAVTWKSLTPSFPRTIYGSRPPEWSTTFRS